ncbi:hypothetical protein QN357_01625 [Cryobacterium sp. RTC2.1]|uniref:hypothetical protein n=1 Tax=Cryobacterium sp. RTC2.1 TaxID=3048634 RepID=UPI002B23BFB9|nr:hypothetical protein [Cryobacterium sp. RTC2.1]MEB0001636.1 hypothetical protein [Cryobacterium sp. RTC2.1]
MTVGTRSTPASVAEAAHLRRAGNALAAAVRRINADAVSRAATQVEDADLDVAA